LLEALPRHGLQLSDLREARAANLFGDHRHAQGVDRVESNAETGGSGAVITEHWAHDARRFRAVGSAQVMSKLMYEKLQPLSLVDFGVSLTDDALGVQRSSGPSHMDPAAFHFPLAGEADGDPGR